MFIWFCHTHSTRVLTRAKILKLSLFWKSDFLVLLLKCIVGSLSSQGGGIFWGNARDTSHADQRLQDNSFLHTSGSPCHHVTVSPSHNVSISQCHHVTLLGHHVTMSPYHNVTMWPCHNVSISKCHHVTFLGHHHSPCHYVTVLRHNFKVSPLSTLVEYNSLLHTFGSQICFFTAIHSPYNLNLMV